MIRDYATAEERLMKSKRQLAHLCEIAIKDEQENLNILKKRAGVILENLRILNKRNFKLI